MPHVIKRFDGQNIEVTDAMIALYAQVYNIPAEALEPSYKDYQVPSILGTLADWCSGNGELDARLADSPEGNALFAEIREAYFAAKGQQQPPLSQGVSADEPKANLNPTEPVVESAPVEGVTSEPVVSQE